jgi:hypothetical protein
LEISRELESLIFFDAGRTIERIIQCTAGMAFREWSATPEGSKRPASPPAAAPEGDPTPR